MTKHINGYLRVQNAQLSTNLDDANLLIEEKDKIIEELRSKISELENLHRTLQNKQLEDVELINSEKNIREKAEAQLRVLESNSHDLLTEISILQKRNERLRYSNSSLKKDVAKLNDKVKQKSEEIGEIVAGFACLDQITRFVKQSTDAISSIGKVVDSHQTFQLQTLMEAKRQCSSLFDSVKCRLIDSTSTDLRFKDCPNLQNLERALKLMLTSIWNVLTKLEFVMEFEDVGFQI